MKDKNIDENDQAIEEWEVSEEFIREHWAEDDRWEREDIDEMLEEVEKEGEDKSEEDKEKLYKEKLSEIWTYEHAVMKSKPDLERELREISDMFESKLQELLEVVKLYSETYDDFALFLQSFANENPHLSVMPQYYKEYPYSFSRLRFLEALLKFISKMLKAYHLMPYPAYKYPQYKAKDYSEELSSIQKLSELEKRKLFRDRPDLLWLYTMRRLEERATVKVKAKSQVPEMDSTVTLSEEEKELASQNLRTLLEGWSRASRKRIEVRKNE